MATNLNDPEAISWPDEAHSPEAVAYLRAHGVRPATQPWDPSRRAAKQRPWWLAFIIRSLRKLHLYDD